MRVQFITTNEDSYITYDVINTITGEQEPFTGHFKDFSKAEEWERTKLDYWEKKGRTLIKVIAHEKFI